MPILRKWRGQVASALDLQYGVPGLKSSSPPPNPLPPLARFVFVGGSSVLTCYKFSVVQLQRFFLDLSCPYYFIFLFYAFKSCIIYKYFCASSLENSGIVFLSFPSKTWSNSLPLQCLFVQRVIAMMKCVFTHDNCLLIIKTHQRELLWVLVIHLPNDFRN